MALGARKRSVVLCDPRFPLVFLLVLLSCGCSLVDCCAVVGFRPSNEKVAVESPERYAAPTTRWHPLSVVFLTGVSAFKVRARMTLPMQQEEVVPR